KHHEPVKHYEPIAVAAPAPLPPTSHAPLPPAPPASQASVLVPLAARVEVPSPQPANDMRFKPEPTIVAARKPQQAPWMRMAVAAAVIAFLTTGGLYAVRRRASASNLPAGTGTLMVQSNPAGVPIDIDGKASGVTPATLSLTAGTHTLQLRAGGPPKTMTVSVTAGAQVSQYIELAKTAATGGLIVRTEPAGAQVSIDRVPQGASPVTANNLAPGDHTVVVTYEG